MRYVAMMNDDTYLTKDGLWRGEEHACRFKSEIRAKQKASYYTDNFRIMSVADHKPKSFPFIRYLSA